MTSDVSTRSDEDREFKKPVSWLLGRQLLSGMKWIAVYTFFGDKIDPKDWMTAPSNGAPTRQFDVAADADEFWFDFIADTGDGMKATYTIAYLCMSDLYAVDVSAPASAAIGLTAAGKESVQLSRGEFLFVGGDVAYHIADSASLKERFQTPFNWAYDDLVADDVSVARKPLFGIPANHDYYDALDGFNRQFRRPLAGDQPCVAEAEADASQPQLCLKGFERVQESSFLALNMPFGWRLWGMDTQAGRMDKRQWAYFVSTFYPEFLQRPGLFDSDDINYEELQSRVPSQLIVVTPEPSTVFGQYAREDSDMARTFYSLGLERSFLAAKQGSLQDNRCRLDLSGDIHHYERYWGNRGSSPNYASVVAGGGGAFLHPSHCSAHEVTPECVAPAPQVSHALFTRALLNPWNIATGGSVWLAGAVVAMLTYIAVTVAESTWTLFELIPDSKRPAANGGYSLLANAQRALDTTKSTAAGICCGSSYWIDLVYITATVFLLIYWLKVRVPTLFTDHRNRECLAWNVAVAQLLGPISGWCALILVPIFMDRDTMPGAFLASLLVALFAIAAVLLFALIRRYSDLLIKRARFCRERPVDWVPLWVLGILAVTFAAFGFLHYGVYPASPMTLNLILVAVWGLTIAGLIGLAVVVGGQLQGRDGKLKFAALGAWHAFLQIVTPTIMVLYMDWINLAILSILLAAATLFAGMVFSSIANAGNINHVPTRQTAGSMLLATWLVLGIAMLVTATWGEPVAVTFSRLLAAGVLGALFSCLWFGWYLAVCLAFDGHSNEAGGGARFERHRHFIRFRLTADKLTGYVIGFDEPETDLRGARRSTVRFDLIDVFEIARARSD